MRVPTVVILCGLLAGCAFSEVTVDVPYKAGAVTALANPGQVNLSVADGRTEDRTRISTKMNGYGMEGGAIRSSRSVPDLVQDALSSEMKARGLNISTSGVPMSVAVRRFYCQYHTVEAIGDVALDVSLKDQNGPPFTQTYTGASKIPVMIFNGGNAAEAVAAALQDAIGKMFADPQLVQALAKRNVALK